MAESTSSTSREFPWRRRLQLWRAARAHHLGRDRFKKEDFALFRLEVEIAGLDRAWSGYRLVQLTDIHLGQWLSPDRLEGVVDLTNSLQADLVALTGDFLSYDLDGSARDLEAAFGRLQAKDGVFAVLGNHDHWVGAARVRALLDRCRVRELRNDVVTLRRGGAVLHLAGVDDVMVHQDDLAQVLARLPAEGPALLLAHEPDFADRAARTGRFALQLSGHSHGGQVVLPGLGSLVRGPYCWKYPVGRYQVKDMTLYTNRGLGSNMWWVRVNCPPEITLVTLRSRQTEV